MPRDRWPWFAFDPRWRLWSIRRYILHYIALYCIAWHPYANDDRYGVTFCILHCIALYLIRRKAMINMALYLPFPPTSCTIKGYAQGNVYWEWLYNCSFWQWQWHWPLVTLPNLLFQVSRGTRLPVSHTSAIWCNWHQMLYSYAHFVCIQMVYHRYPFKYHSNSINQIYVRVHWTSDCAFKLLLGRIIMHFLCICVVHWGMVCG